MFKSRYKNYHANLSFLDLLFQLILGFSFLFIVSVMLVAPQRKNEEAQIRTKAEFVITLTWDNKCPDDVDLWVEDPNGTIMWYRDKEVGLMHLDRDDLGNINDIITLPDGSQITFPYNQEIGTIRGAIAGEWTVNVQMYAKRDLNPANVVVKIEKLNPTVRLILLRNVTMANDKEEMTITRLEMNEAGDVLSMSELPKGLVSTKLEAVRGSGP